MLCTFAPPPPVTLDLFPRCFVRLFNFMFRSTPSPHSVSPARCLLRSRQLTTDQSCSLSSDEDSPKHVRIYPALTPHCLNLLLQFGSNCNGTHKIHYQPQQQWDFTTDADDHPVDLSLVLPHYRARSQPAGHQMSMYIHSSGEIKSTIVSAPELGMASPLTSYLSSAVSPLARPSSCL